MHPAVHHISPVAYFNWAPLLLVIMGDYSDFVMMIGIGVEGGGQPVLSFEQCFVLFCSFPLLFAFIVGGLGFKFCVFVAAGGLVFGVSGLLLLLLLL